MSSFRNLALAGLLAASGCAGTAQSVRPERHAPPTGRQTALPTETCLRQTTRLQECMIEGLATVCRERSPGNEEGMLSCMDEGLRQPVTQEHRAVSVTVAQGEEVYSLRIGGPAVFQIIKLDARAVDQTGVDFTYTVDRVFAANPTEHSSIDNVQLRMNFDGTRTGDWTLPAAIEMWNFRVESAEGGRARVSFETVDPRVTVRGATAAPAAEKQKGEPRKAVPPKPAEKGQKPVIITEP